MSSDVSPENFTALQTTLEQQGLEAVWKQLAAQLLAEQEYSQLYELRKMQVRHKLGLPVLTNLSVDDLEEPLATQVVESYLEACREVGELYLKDGKLPEAWQYLRMSGNRQPVADALEKGEPDEEQMEAWIGIAVQERVHPRRGFEWVLKHYGTCNAVTMFEGETQQLTAAKRGETAEVLVGHLHKELYENLAGEVQREEGSAPQEKTIRELVADRDWLFSDNAYHIDTSHLSMVVRFARWVTNPHYLKLALDMTEYGRRLSSQYQYESEEPFKELYLGHAKFFAAQIGQDVDANVAFFAEKAKLDPGMNGSFPAEVYLCLLARLGRDKEALACYTELLPPGSRTLGMVPSLEELTERSRVYGPLRNFYAEHGDRVGYLGSLIQERLTAPQ